jgi:hypothetical protein
MEAVAKYAYTASSPSELSFKAGETMKVGFIFLRSKEYLY